MASERDGILSSTYRVGEAPVYRRGNFRNRLLIWGLRRFETAPTGAHKWIRRVFLRQVHSKPVSFNHDLCRIAASDSPRIIAALSSRFLPDPGKRHLYPALTSNVEDVSAGGYHFKLAFLA